MENGWKKLGLVAVGGVLFGTLAGGSFVGVKAGAEYLTGHFAPPTITEETFTEGNSHAAEESTEMGIPGSKIGKDADEEKDEDKDEDKDTSEATDQTVTASVQTSDQTYDVADLAEKAMPSLVSITNTSEYRSMNGFFDYGQIRTAQSSGSGVIVGETDDLYYIVTNNHVVDGASELTVGFVDDTDASAKIVGTAPSGDLAVVSVNKADLTAETKNAIRIAALGDSTSLRVGEQVVAIGNALGYGQSVTVGYVSALNQEVTLQTGVTMPMIQTDAAINPGNSGGALFNMKGEVVGINAAKAANMINNVEGMGYSIPITNAIPIADSIIHQTEEVATGGAILGVKGADVTAELAQSYGLPQGVYLTEIYSDYPAASAGLHVGDVITAVDGTKISSIAELKTLIGEKNPGDVVELSVSRAGTSGTYREGTVKVTLSSK